MRWAAEREAFVVETHVKRATKETLKITDYLYTEYGATSCHEGALTRSETIGVMDKLNFELLDNFSFATKAGNLLFRNRNFRTNP